MADMAGMAPEHSSLVEPEVQADEPAARPITRLDRIVTIVALGIAFVVMASVFSPEWSRAGYNQSSRATPPPSPSGNTANQRPGSSLSTDPHEGLAMIGELHDGDYVVRMYAAPGGALYSVYDAQGQELGVLLTPSQVEKRFPELEIQNVRFESRDASPHDARSGVQLLHAGSDDDSMW